MRSLQLHLLGKGFMEEVTLNEVWKSKQIKRYKAERKQSICQPEWKGRLNEDLKPKVLWPVSHLRVLTELDNIIYNESTL